MIRPKAIKMLEAKLKCLENRTSGDYEKCNSDCVNCSLYYVQGNLNHQKEYIKMSIEALKEDLYNEAVEILKSREQEKVDNNDLY